jgi:hypothetical protein
MMDGLAAIAAGVIAVLITNLLVTQVFGVSLLCHMGIHRWRRTLVGRARDTRYVVKCKDCEMLKDDFEN